MLLPHSRGIRVLPYMYQIWDNILAARRRIPRSRQRGSQIASEGSADQARPSVDGQMSRKKAVTARNARDLAKVLELSDSERAALEVQLELTERIVFEVRRLDITHVNLARLAGTSRPRVTAILNGNLEGVSTDLLLRLLAALNVRVELRFRRAA